MITTHNLGYPRIGTHRELKQACEHYWAGQISREDLANCQAGYVATALYTRSSPNQR